MKSLESFTLVAGTQLQTKPTRAHATHATHQHVHM